MIIRMLLEELCTQLRDIVKYENIQIYKFVDSIEVRNYYSSDNNEISSYNLNKIMSNINLSNYILEMVKSDEDMFVENIHYNFEHEEKDESVCFIPISFRGQAMFCISMLTSNENFHLTEDKKQKIMDIIDSFNEVFCFKEMMRIDMIRDRMSVTF